LSRPILGSRLWGLTAVHNTGFLEVMRRAAKRDERQEMTSCECSLLLPERGDLPIGGRSDSNKGTRWKSRRRVVQFGLAILVFGGWTVFFNHPARIALPIVTLGLMLVAPFSNVNLSSGEKEDRGNRFCVVASVCAWFSGNLDRRKALGH
jgi:hypothetical protein